MDKAQMILKLIVSQKATIGYSLMALLTIGGERIFSMISFQCPCNRKQNLSYGLSFLLGPAVVLFALSLITCTRFWRLYTGCCRDTGKLCPRGNCLKCFKELVKILCEACVPSVMWLGVSLLNATFYECAISGMDDSIVVNSFCKNKTLKCREELSQVPCDRSKLSKEERMELLLMFRAQSQTLGWSIIACAAMAALLGTCYKNCRSKVSYMQLMFWNQYIEKEKSKFADYCSEYASKLATRNLDSFFEAKKPAPMSFPSHRAWQKISKYYTFSRKDDCYTILHKHVEEGDCDLQPEISPVIDGNKDENNRIV